jgi:subtilase family serine protease
MRTAVAVRRPLVWATVTLLVLLMCAMASTRPSRSAPLPSVTPSVAGHLLFAAHPYAAPPTTAQCEAQFQIACYSPNQFATAYRTKQVNAAGITGRGTTIAVVDSFGSPTIAHDLHVFDRAFGLPDPPSLRTITPAGPLPPFDLNNGDMVNWAVETTLDVEYAHAMAPQAKILVVATPVDETEGLTGLPQMIQAENFVLDHHLADVISQSFGATEQTFPGGNPVPTSLRTAFIKARAMGVTVLASTGDTGATNFKLDLVHLYHRRVVGWPATDPLVTAVGGTQLHLDAAGHRTSPDVVWNDGFGAGGGGLSSWFSRPAFQDGVSSVVGNRRGIPDVSMSAAVDGAAILYFSFVPSAVGFHLVGGTSEASPMFAGIVALADQLAGHRLGDISFPLYELGQIGAHAGIVDITSGNNSFAGVTGFRAGPGYDLASGVGTIDAVKFVPALVAAAAVS